SDGGTGGGAFRNMYGKFLIEASDMFNSKEMADIGKKFIQIAKAWDATANHLKMLYETANLKILDDVSNRINEIANNEKESLIMLLKTVK
ncbi:MAG: DUF4872 domain-containing protein, partial [Deltaproteobacteria bacterium]|nr:DUF4872 domain-containing protein [Deltaproteobacteria bacterium]